MVQCNILDMIARKCRDQGWDAVISVLRKLHKVIPLLQWAWEEIDFDYHNKGLGMVDKSCCWGRADRTYLFTVSNRSLLLMTICF